MARAIIIGGLAVLLILILAQTNVPSVSADHSDGHLLVNGLLKKLIESPTAPALCGPEFPTSTQAAAQNWKNTAGTGGGNVINIFTYQSSCTGADVIVTTTGYSNCPGGSHGCVPLAPADDYGIVTPVYAYMNPSLFGVGKQWPDGNAHTSRDITHELGHTLGFDDYHGCGFGNTVMDSDETQSCFQYVPTALDDTNYHNAYHADAVTSFAATSISNTVNFTWNASNVHNERAFLINWRNDCTGQWQIAAAPAKNAQSFSLPNQQGGLQQYQILPLTYADPDHNFVGDVSPVLTVNVSASLQAPASMASSFPSATVTRFTWPASLGAHHYKVKYDVVPSGMVFPACTDNVMSTQFDWVVPDQHQTSWYSKIAACDAAGVCSPPTLTHVLTERYNSGVFNYAFTVSRSGTDNINLKLLNKSTVWALMVHVRHGDPTSSLWVADSACVAANAAAISMPPMSWVFSFSPDGKLATQGHGALSATTCRAPTDHSGDAPAMAWGFVAAQ